MTFLIDVLFSTLVDTIAGIVMMLLSLPITILTDTIVSWLSPMAG